MYIKHIYKTASEPFFQCFHLLQENCLGFFSIPCTIIIVISFRRWLFSYPSADPYCHCHCHSGSHSIITTNHCIIILLLLRSFQKLFWAETGPAYLPLRSKDENRLFPAIEWAKKKNEMRWEGMKGMGKENEDQLRMKMSTGKYYFTLFTRLLILSWLVPLPAKNYY